MKHFSLVVAFSFFLGGVFFYFPEVDLYLASFFYNSNTGFKNQSYYLENFNPVMLLLDYGAIYIVPASFVAFILFLSIRLYNQNKSFHYKHYLPVIYIVLTTLIGPLLLLNTIKDEIFCRARPEAIKEFKGHKKFTPAFALSDQCSKNCSFISGHAAAIFMLFSLAFLIENQKKRRKAILYITFFGLLVGVGRMSFGKHFASDIVFSGFFVYIVSYIMALLFKLPSTRKNGTDKTTN
ncbi:MAG: phosphatase PAP2 family protein [Candidatus Midichloria sp.]|nr:MAG: phosphatase PAP2 family protein [Candidatus Midichloria sp.]